MSLWKNIKGFLMKEDYDFDRPDVNLHNFHPQLYAIYMLNGVFFINKDSKLRFPWPVLNMTLSFISTAFEIMFIYRALSLKDYAFASESFCYLVILGTVPIVCMSNLYNKEIIIEQVNKMDCDLVYISRLGPTYREPFLKGQLIIWQLCWAWIGFILVILILFVGNTMTILVYQSLIAPQEAYSTRPLIFPMWLPEDDPYRTPNYEVFMFLQILLITVVIQSFGTYVYLQFHILLHYYNLMDLIILDLERVFDGLDESVIKLPSNDPRRVQVQISLNSRMKRIVRWHLSVLKSVATVSSVYGPPLAYQVMFSSVAICIMAYQVVDQLENGKVDFLFAILWIGGIVQLWIPCYLGTLMQNKAFSMGDACWNCGWHETPLGPMLRTDILMFILRTQKPLNIKFPILPSLTLETFSSIMSSSYTYFNMLRQSTKG